MTRSPLDEAASHQQMAGALVREEIDRRGWTTAQAMDGLHMLPSVLDRLLTGRLSDAARDKQFAKAEQALGLPAGLLGQIATADVTAIELRGDLDLTRKAHLMRAFRRLRPKPPRAVTRPPGVASQDLPASP